jgi:hypothetical protein
MHQKALRNLVAAFGGGQISFDGGSLLLREIEQGRGYIRELARCFRDDRDHRFVEHSLEREVDPSVLNRPATVTSSRSVQRDTDARQWEGTTRRVGGADGTSAVVAATVLSTSPDVWNRRQEIDLTITHRSRRGSRAQNSNMLGRGGPPRPRERPELALVGVLGFHLRRIL